MAGAGGAAGTTGAAGAAPGLYSNYCSPVHWKFSAPTATNANDFPSNVVDNNIASRWSTGANQAPGQFFQIDFGGTISLTQVILDASNAGGTDYPRGLALGLSADGATFAPVATSTPTTPVVTVSFTAAQGRYLRINQTGTAAVWWSIDELHLMCTVPGNNAGLVDPYDPTYWKASASVTPANGDIPANAIDTDATTRWSTGRAMAAGDSFTVDMGGVVMISGVTYDDGGDFPVAYKMELSTDCAAYTQVATGPGTTGSTVVTFVRQNARCFRMTQTGTTGMNYWSIYGITTQM